MNALPDALTAKIMSILPFLPPQAVEVLSAVVDALPMAVETGYGSIKVEFRDHIAQVEVTSSKRIGK